MKRYKKKAHKDYYVYILYREDGKTPFYVGKGKGNRWLSHERWAKKGSSYKDNIICQMKDKGVKVPKRKYKQFLSSEEACALEIKLIAKIGRCCNGGTLVNLTDGGDAGTPGYKHTEEFKAARKLWRPTKEMRDKLSKALRGKPKSEQAKANLSMACLGRVITDEAKAKMRASHERRKRLGLNEEVNRKKGLAWLGKHHTKKSKEKIRKAITGIKRSAETKWKIAARFRDPSLMQQHRDAVSRGSVGKKLTARHKNKIRLSLLGRKHSEETKAKIGVAHLGMKHTEETKEKIRKANLGRKDSKERREINSRGQIGRKHSDKTKAKISQSQCGKTYSSETLNRMTLGQRKRRRRERKLKKNLNF